MSEKPTLEYMQNFLRARAMMSVAVEGIIPDPKADTSGMIGSTVSLRTYDGHDIATVDMKTEKVTEGAVLAVLRHLRTMSQNFRDYEDACFILGEWEFDWDELPAVLKRRDEMLAEAQEKEGVE